MEKNVESAEKSSENDIDEDNLVLRPLLWRAWENQVGNPSEDEAKKAGRGNDCQDHLFKHWNLFLLSSWQYPTARAIIHASHYHLGNLAANIFF